mmetsp:Transcript_38180/g.78299  ORF Transcript_38180/g.78299 Transcript_38180/m.78299 type:complete len:293 (-) Transcript_38180:906-1784(-)
MAAVLRGSTSFQHWGRTTAAATTAAEASVTRLISPHNTRRLRLALNFPLNSCACSISSSSNSCLSCFFLAFDLRAAAAASESESLVVRRGWSSALHSVSTRSMPRCKSEEGKPAMSSLSARRRAWEALGCAPSAAIHASSAFRSVFMTDRSTRIALRQRGGEEEGEAWSASSFSRVPFAQLLACKPMGDTLTMLSHSFANTFNASLFPSLPPSFSFSFSLPPFPPSLSSAATSGCMSRRISNRRSVDTGGEGEEGGGGSASDCRRRKESVLAHCSATLPPLALSCSVTGKQW